MGGLEPAGSPAVTTTAPESEAAPLGPPTTTEEVARRLGERLPQILADSPPVVLERTVLAVAALHETDEQGYCRVCVDCRSRRWRWWRRAPSYPCPTRRVMWVELHADTGPRFTAA